MRALAALALAALLVAGAVPVSAAPAEAASSAQSAGESASVREKQGRAKEWGDGNAPSDPRQQPAHGARYAWRQMGMAAAIMAAMLVFVIWLIRRQTRARR